VSTTPLALREWAFCQAFNAFSVAGPKSPSALTPTAFWIVFTAGPVAPLEMTAQVVTAGFVVDVVPACAGVPTSPRETTRAVTAPSFGARP
jgi:hypothetical protein